MILITRTVAVTARCDEARCLHSTRATGPTLPAALEVVRGAGWAVSRTPDANGPGGWRSRCLEHRGVGGRPRATATATA